MAGTVTALRIQKKNKERVNVFLDGEFAFALGLMDASELRKGQQLSDDDIARLRASGDFHKAYNQAVRFLGYRPRSLREIERSLAKKDHDEETIAGVIDRLEREGYADDRAFARFWIDNRTQFKPRSARALRYELREKGIQADIIDEELAELDEESAAWDAAVQKIERWRGLEQREFDQKLSGHLSRRGFGYGVARTTCDRAWSYLHEPEDEDEFGSGAESLDLNDDSSH